MTTSFGALCSDFYVNQKIAVKLDTPSNRETVLSLLDRVRKSHPGMKHLRRYEAELALESSRKDAPYHWMSLRRTSVRAGVVNPDSMPQALAYHRMLAEVTPYYLSLSPLDVDHLEVMFGFDLECDDDHDQVIYQALFDGSPLGQLLDPSNPGRVLSVQPVLGQSLTPNGSLQAHYEVKTRRKSRRGSSRPYRSEPISLFLTLRRYGPLEEVGELAGWLAEMVQTGEALATEKLVPCLLTPISRHITSSSP